MSVVITTSPVPSHPSTMMLTAVLNSFSRVRTLQECSIVIVCDGFNLCKKITWKAGRITEEAAANYESYLENLEAMLNDSRLPDGTKLVFLDGRNGQAMGVLAGLMHVSTPHVLVHQHDLEFMFDFNLSSVLDVLDDPDNDVKYAGLPLLTNLSYEAIAWQHHGVRVNPVQHHGVSMVPIVFWYDSTHIASTQHYRDLVFGPSQTYELGNFVEETFGVRQRSHIMEAGLEVHSMYGTYHLISEASDGTRRPLICHLNGVRFLTPEQRAERGYPADPPVEFFPSRVMLNKRQRKVRSILDTVERLAGIEKDHSQQIRNILSMLLNETRIRISKPASTSLPQA